MDVMKRNAEVIGRLRYPLAVGMPAYIQQPDGVLRTSCIVSVDERTGTHVRFETRNTNYRVVFEGGVPYERI